MTGAEPLLTAAEVGVAFAGFASVVTVFRRREDGDWSAPDAIRFQLMITSSLSAVFFALLPFAFELFGAQERSTWSACSALLALFVGALLVPTSRRASALASTGALSPWVAWPFLAGAVTVTALLVLNALGTGFQRESGPYFASLLYLLVLSGVSFARLLPIGRGAGAQ